MITAFVLPGNLHWVLKTHLAMQHFPDTAQRSDSAHEAALPQAGAREAIIVGGGVAGLLAAHVACQHGFSRVTLLDRDLLGGKVEQETLQEVGAGLQA